MPLPRLGQAGVGHRHQAGDDARRLAVLDQALGGILFDDAHRLGAQGVAQDALDLEALAGAVGVIAQPFSSMPMSDGRRWKVSSRWPRPAHRHRIEAVKTRLIVGFDLFHRRARRARHLGGDDLFSSSVTSRAIFVSFARGVTECTVWFVCVQCAISASRA